MDAVTVVIALGGCARRPDLRRLVSRRRLDAAVSSGALVLERGLYRAPGAAEQDLVAARQLRGIRSHLAAARHHGLAVPPHDVRSHVTVGRNARRRHVPAEVAVHYRTLDAERVSGDVTDVLQTVVDCLKDLTLADALAVGDSALRSGLVHHDRLATAVGSLRGPGSRLARHRLTLLDARAENAFESCMRALLLQAGLSGFTPQVIIWHRGQFIGRADLADVLLRLVIECDGFDTHGTLAGMSADATRHTRLAAAGWRTLRFTWHQVMFRPAWVVEQVKDTVTFARAAA